MTTELERLELILAATTEELRREFRRAEQQSGRTTRRLEQDMRRLDTAVMTAGRGLRNLLAGAGIAIGVQASSRQLSNLTTRVLSTAAAIQQMSDVIGITAEELQVYRAIAADVEISTGSLDTALQRFSRRVGEAARGTGVLKDILEDNDIALRNADGTMRSINDILRDYADVVRDAGNDQEQLSLAVAAFDTEAARMVNVIDRGADALDEMAAEARETADVIRNDLIRRGDELNTQLGRLRVSMGNAFDAAVLEELSGGLESIEGDFDQITEAARRMGTIVGGVINEIANAFNELMALSEGELEGLRVIERLMRLTVPSGGPRAPIITRDQLAVVPNVEQLTGDLTDEIAASEIRMAELRDQIARLSDDAEGGIRIAAEGFTRGTRNLLESELDALEASVAEARERLSVLQDLPPLPGTRPVMQDEGAGSPIAPPSRTRLPVIEGTGLERSPINDEPLARADSLARATAQTEDNAAAQDRLNELMREAGRIFADTRTPTEAFNAELRRLEELSADPQFMSALTIQAGGTAEALEAMDRAIAAANKNMPNLDKSIQDVTETTEWLEDAFRDFGQQAVKALGDIITGADDASEALSRLLSNFANMAASQAFQGLFDLGISSLFSPKGGLFGGGAIPGKAMGGPISGPAIVGERGPELFVPASAGRIVPNNQLGSMGGPVFHVDLRGASVEAVERLERFVNQINGSIESRAVGAVQNARQRGGSFANAFR